MCKVLSCRQRLPYTSCDQHSDQSIVAERRQRGELHRIASRRSSYRPQSHQVIRDWACPPWTFRGANACANPRYRPSSYQDHLKHLCRFAKRLRYDPEYVMGQAYSAVDRYSFEERHRSLKLLQTAPQNKIELFGHESASSGSDTGDYLLGLIRGFVYAINSRTWRLPPEFTYNVHPEFEVGCTFGGRLCRSYHEYLDVFRKVADEVPNLDVEVVFETAEVDEVQGYGVCYVLTETTGTTHGWRDGTPIKTKSHAINVVEFVRENGVWLFRNQTWARGIKW